MEIGLLVIGILLVWFAISWISDNVRRANLYDELKPRLDSIEGRENQLKSEQESWRKKVETEKAELEILAKEKSKGFPWLARAYIESNRGELYVMSVQEAEEMGFRRAFRWRGS